MHNPLIPGLRRAGTLTLATAVALGLAASAHAANIGGATCDPTTSRCTVTAAGSGGQTVGGGSGAASGGVSDPNASTIVPGVPDRCLAVWSPPPGVLPAQYSSLDVNPADGVWYTSTCPQYGNGPGIPSYFQGIAPGAGAPPAVPLVVVAQQAEKQLNLPTPVIESSPGGGGAPQSVELPTWAWLPAAQWAPRSATASVPGESVTATATPIAVTWSWGDGTSSVCHGAGTAYVKGVSDPAAPSPDCGHTYHQTSAGAPDQRFPVTATLTWNVAWNGGGRNGVFPGLTTQSTVHWTVRQIQSLIVNP